MTVLSLTGEDVAEFNSPHTQGDKSSLSSRCLVQDARLTGEDANGMYETFFLSVELLKQKEKREREYQYRTLTQ